MSNKFSVFDILNDSSQHSGNNNEMKITMIDVFDIQESPDNFYSTNDIDALADSIEMFGVQQNLRVKALDNGKYGAIVGHRRRLACIKLVNEGKEQFRYVPCVIESSYDTIKEKLILILTNSTQRELSDYEKVEQMKLLKELLIEYKKEHALPGRVRDLIADSLNVSATQVARMESISHNLSDDLKEEFKGEKISISTAYELSGLDNKKQEEIYQKVKEQESSSATFNISLKEIKDIKRAEEAELLKQEIDEPLPAIVETKNKVSKNIEIPVFEEDDGEAYGATRHEIIVSLVKDIVQYDTAIEDIDGERCEAFGKNYFAYNCYNDGYIWIEDDEGKKIFKTSVSRFQLEYEFHKARLEALPDDLEPDEDEDISDESIVVVKKQEEETLKNTEVDNPSDELKKSLKPRFSAIDHLKDAIKREEEQITLMRDSWSKSNPDALLKHETILLALKLHLTDMEYPAPEPIKPVQPELPIFKNNDQRKEFIESYPTWPIWIDTKATGERYYRYDFDDEKSMVVKVSLCHRWVGGKIGYSTETSYSREEYYLLEENRCFSECGTNKSSLIEYLKDLQRN